MLLLCFIHIYIYVELFIGGRGRGRRRVPPRGPLARPVHQGGAKNTHQRQGTPSSYVYADVQIFVFELYFIVPFIVKSKSVHQHAHVGASEASLVAPKPASSLGGGGFALRPPPPPGSVVGGGGAASKPAVSGGSSSGSNISSSSGIIGSGAEGDAAAGAEEEWSDFA